jgi:hypothetical protein
MTSENDHGCAQNAENGFFFAFLERYQKDIDEFLNHIVRVTDDETWVSFVNVETKEPSEQWMHTHSQNEPKMLEQTTARKLMATFLGQERSDDGGIHATRDYNNIRSALHVKH